MEHADPELTLIHEAVTSTLSLTQSGKGVGPCITTNSLHL